MRLTCTCRATSPHELSADVKVFGEEKHREPFITLDLTIGSDVIHVFLPAHAYQRARDIADIWPQLVDKSVSRPSICDDCLTFPSDPPSSLCPGCQAYREHQQ